MDSQFRAFESPMESQASLIATPLPCPRPMRAQTIAVRTPYRILGAAVMALLAVPRRLVLAPVINRRRRA